MLGERAPGLASMDGHLLRLREGLGAVMARTELGGKEKEGAGRTLWRLVLGGDLNLCGMGGWRVSAC